MVLFLRSWDKRLMFLTLLKIYKSLYIDLLQQSVKCITFHPCPQNCEEFCNAKIALKVRFHRYSLISGIMSQMQPWSTALKLVRFPAGQRYTSLENFSQIYTNIVSTY